jgi:hypothetical protein
VLSRKKNRVPKGKGKDARPDARDHYMFISRWSYRELAHLNGAAPTAQLLFRITASNDKTSL